ncbi:MAG: hypothetical protein U0587_08770 [Candidatus Binatia bacterium]
MLSYGLVSEKIEFSCCRVRFDLSIPPSMIVFDEPLPQPYKRLVVEILDLSLNLLNVAHDILGQTQLQRKRRDQPNGVAMSRAFFSRRARSPG